MVQPLPINGKQIVRQMALDEQPCPNCGGNSIIVVMLGELRLNSSILIAQQVPQPQGGPQQVTARAQPLEAHALCLQCLRRETWGPAGNDWKREVTYNGIALPVEVSDDATPSTPGR